MEGRENHQKLIIDKLGDFPPPSARRLPQGKLAPCPTPNPDQMLLCVLKPGLLSPRLVVRLLTQTVTAAPTPPGHLVPRSSDRTFPPRAHQGPGGVSQGFVTRGTEPIYMVHAPGHSGGPQPRNPESSSERTVSPVSLCFPQRQGLDTELARRSHTSKHGDGGDIRSSRGPSGGSTFSDIRMGTRESQI